MKGHKAWVVRAYRRFARWYQLSRERAFLRRINDETLKDLGLSRADIYTESHRAFWEDPPNP
ncbi:DUF1127 domain-containing protein [Pseudomonas sp.]|uniref:DUF1127 domain-containing protein n=1 Tax=Pseudomonas sp. TaxID=306 RepID=UPI00345D6C17